MPTRAAIILIGVTTTLAVVSCRDTTSPVSRPAMRPDRTSDRGSPKGQAEFPILVSPQTDNAFFAATDGGHFLIAASHYDNTTGITTPEAVLLGPSGEVGQPLVLGSNAGGVGDQAGDVPIVAFDGTHYLVVFQANDSLDVRGQFIDRSGAAVGASFLITSTASQVANGVRVEGIAYTAGTYLVSYERPASVDDPDSPLGAFARTVSTTGAVGAELSLATPSSQASIAADGSNFLAVYVVGTGPTRRAEARFISPSGVLGATITLSSPGFPTHQPNAVGFNGANYLAVWPYQLTPGQPAIAYAAQAITPGGALAGTVATFPLDDDTGKVCVAVAGETGNFLVSYEEGPPQSQRSSARFFAANGAPLGGPLAVAAPDAESTSTFSCVWPAHGNRYLNLIMRKGSTPASFFHVDGSFTVDLPGGAP